MGSKQADEFREKAIRNKKGEIDFEEEHKAILAELKRLRLRK